MDLKFERPGDHLYIRSQDERGICIGEAYYTESVIVSPEHVIGEWPPRNVEDLQAKHLLPIFELRPEVLLLGTGEHQLFLPPRMMVALYEMGIGIEVMTTSAACRTFNVLVSEGRNVVAALMQ